MIRAFAIAACVAAGSLVPWDTAGAQWRRCPPDSVRVGPVCADRYEASVWKLPAMPRVVNRLQRGRMDLSQLQAEGAVQMGAIPEDGCTGTEYGDGFPWNGNWTEPLYAASIAGAVPSTCITWFQAEQACRLAGKRLLTNAEWQAAAAGTPDWGDLDDHATTCATNSAFAVPAGSRSACVSSWGAFDMAGNVWEWVAEWISPASGCTFWHGTYGGDLSCVGMAPQSGPSPQELTPFNPNLPGGIIRGGNYATGQRNGIFAVFAGGNPHTVSRSTGFRCGR